jgi:hypothetical protein
MRNAVSIVYKLRWKRGKAKRPMKTRNIFQIVSVNLVVFACGLVLGHWRGEQSAEAAAKETLINFDGGVSIINAGALIEIAERLDAGQVEDANRITKALIEAAWNSYSSSEAPSKRPDDIVEQTARKVEGYLVKSDR